MDDLFAIDSTGMFERAPVGARSERKRAPAKTEEQEPTCPDCGKPITIGRNKARVLKMCVSNLEPFLPGVERCQWYERTKIEK